MGIERGRVGEGVGGGHQNNYNFRIQMSALSLLEYLKVSSTTLPFQYFLIFQSEKVIGIVKSKEGLKLK